MENPMENQPLADDVTYSSPDVDVDAIMSAIRHKIRERSEQESSSRTHLPEFEYVTWPAKPLDAEYNRLLYYHLRQVSRLYNRFDTELNLSPSSLQRMPLVGALWNAIRRRLHSLSLYYLIKIVQPLLLFNQHLVSVLNILAHEDQRRNVELAELKQRVAELEVHLARSEDSS